MLTMTEIRKLKNKAADFVAEGKFNKAVKLYETVYKQSPDDLVTAQRLAEGLRKLGETARSAEVYRSLVEGYVRGGFLLKAISLCRVILEINPADKEVEGMLATLYAKQHGMPKGDMNAHVKLRVFTAAKQEAALADTNRREAARPPLATPAKPAAARVEKAPAMPRQESGRIGVSFEEAQVAESASEVEEAGVSVEESDILAEENEPAGVTIEEQPEELPTIPIFSELGKSAFIALLNKVVLKVVPPGELLVREGEAGDALYAIVEGKVTVFKYGEQREKIELAILGQGEIFGEMALISGRPRIASVEALTSCELLVISKEVYERLTEQHPSMKKVLHSFYRRRLLGHLFAISPVFRPLPDGEKNGLLQKFKAVACRKGETILREGSDADGLYVIVLGEVEVSATRGCKRVRTALLREGAVFGETSLLNRKACSETYAARRDTSLLVLSRRRFNEVILTHPLVLEAVSNIASRREQASAQTGEKAGVKAVVLV